MMISVIVVDVAEFDHVTTNQWPVTRPRALVRVSYTHFVCCHAYRYIWCFMYSFIFKIVLRLA